MVTIIVVGFTAIVVLVAVVLFIRRLCKTAENVARALRPGGLLDVIFGSDESEPGKEE
jgi:cobalamin biosynthesis protein CobD/CbiB